MVSLDFSPLHFITNKRCSVYDSYVLVSPVLNRPLDFQIISHSCLYFSIKLKRKENCFPCLHLPWTHHLTSLAPFYFQPTEERCSCPCHVGFLVSAPQPFRHSGFLFLLKLLLSLLCFFFCMKHRCIFCSLLLQEIFINVTEII